MGSSVNLWGLQGVLPLALLPERDFGGDDAQKSSGISYIKVSLF